MPTDVSITLNDVTQKVSEVSTKVAHTEATVEEIRQAILEKGVAITADTTLDELPDKIREIFTMKTTESSPVGEIISFMGNTAPQHYLKCDGTEYAIGSYPYLESFFVTQFGSVHNFGGDGTTTFAVPDLRGEFLRGAGSNSRVNQGSGGLVGEHQNATEIPNIIADGDAIEYISATTSNDSKGVAKNKDSGVKTYDTKYWYSSDITEFANGANRCDSHYTSRPTNTSILYCIKYEPTVIIGDDGEPIIPEEPNLSETDKASILSYILAPEVTEEASVVS